MPELELNPGADGDQKLPYDPRTILVGLVRQRRFIAVCVLASIAAGIPVALLFGRHLYEAQSVLLYRPDLEGRVNDPAFTVPTQANMVLLDTNLEETRRRLNLEASLKQLQSSCEVKTQTNAALLMIEVQWDSPEVAARIANTLRDVFVSNQQKVRQATAAREVEDLRVRIEQVRAKLKAIDARVGEYSAAHGVVDLDKASQNYLTDLSSTELQYDQAQADKRSIDLQIRSAERILDRNQRQGSLKLEALNDLNVRYARLRDAIHEDQNVRSNLQKLELNKLEMERARQLYEQGLIAKAEYDKTELAYRVQKEIALDTSQVKEWRSEISNLDAGMLPESGAPGGSWKEGMMKLFQLQLDQISAGEKVKALEQALDRLRKRMESLPALQRDYQTFARETESAETERKLLEEKLAHAERNQMAKSSEFATVADATPPAYPTKSRRTLIFLAIGAFGTMLGLGVALSRELLNGTVRSAGEAAVKLPIPLLGVVPQLGVSRPTPVSGGHIPEPFRAIALHIQREVPMAGARLLFVSARHGEGVSTVIANVAECLRRERQNVLVVNAQAGASISPDLHELADNAAPTPDTILLDVPPVLESIDAEVVAPFCSAAIVVIASGLTPARSVNEAIARIKATGVPITGAVLNRVDPAYL